MTSSAWFDIRAAWAGVRGGGWGSLTAIIALALGIGGAITAASVAYVGLVRPLPFPHAHELVTVRKVYTPTAMELGIRLSQFDEWRSSLDGTALLAAYAREAATVRDAGAPREAQAAYVVGPFFDLFGMAPERGRTFTEDETSGVAVVSSAYAAALAGSADAALDRSFSVGGQPLRIVGVMPRTFSVTGDVDFWTPARGVQALRMMSQDDARYYSMVGRLFPGGSVAELREKARATAQQQAPAEQRASWQVAVTTLRDALVGDTRPVLLAFSAASGLVLLIACANAAMLLINLAVARTREFAVRLALGATRARVLRMLLFETILIAVVGGGLGWWLAMSATAAIARRPELNLPRVATSLDTTLVTAGAIAASLVVVLLCGAAPFFALRQAHLATPLRAGASTGSRLSRRARGALVVAQLAIAIVLLTGAGLLGRTVWVLSQTNIGLDVSPRVMTMAVPVGQSAVAGDAASRTALVDRLLQEARRLPGVESAGVGSSLPPSVSQILFTVRYTTSNNDRDVTKQFDLVAVTDGYLDTLGARVVQGRLFTAADTASQLPVAVLSQSAMRHLNLEGDVVGRELIMSLPSASGPRVRPRILGVIEDIRYTGLDAPANGAFYVLWRQIPTVRAHLVVRSASDARGLLSSLLPMVRSIDPSLPLSEPQLFDRVVDRALAPRAARFGLVGVYAVASVLLAVVGLSGALIRSVVERQRELAVRAALGAAPDRLVRMVLRQGLGLAVSGAVLGVILSVLGARAASSIIFGVTPYDPATYAGALLGTLAVALMACYLPARRAAATDPVVLLRSE
jgi:putative ABC transport system permease protein